MKHWNYLYVYHFHYSYVYWVLLNFYSLGLIFSLFYLVFYAIQLISEEAINKTHPIELTGYKGLYRFVFCTILLISLAFIPFHFKFKEMICSKDQEWNLVIKSSVFAIKQIFSDWQSNKIFLSFARSGNR